MKTQKKMKQAAIDQILLWIVLVTIFVTFFFFVLNYSVALRIKDNIDALADYGARMVALGRTDAQVVAGMNKIKLGSMATIVEADLNCTEDAATTNYQVQFNAYTTFDNAYFGNNIHGKTVVFNETSEVEKTCNITLTMN